MAKVKAATADNVVESETVGNELDVSTDPNATHGISSASEIYPAAVTLDSLALDVITLRAQVHAMFEKLREQFPNIER